MVVLLKFSSITQDFWSSARVTFELLVTTLTRALAQFGWAASSRKSPGHTKLLFNNYRGHVLLGTFNAAESFFVAFPRFVPQHNPVSELCNQFLRPHGFCADMHCPNQINLINHRWTPTYVKKHLKDDQETEPR